jgi:hypothetical protein
MDDRLDALLEQSQLVRNSFEALAAECGRLTLENERLRASLAAIAVEARAALSSHKRGENEQ